ncbi:MAG: hypothetical protein ACI9U2_003479 [Bradymonadia bacterium]|jgi:hypothetical protein
MVSCAQSARRVWRLAMQPARQRGWQSLAMTTAGWLEETGITRGQLGADGARSRGHRPATTSSVKAPNFAAALLRVGNVGLRR